MYSTLALPLALLTLLSLSSFIFSSSLILDLELAVFNTYSFSSTFIWDPISFLFTSTVLAISSSIFFYSMSYMDDETSPKRFILMLSLFISSMLILISGGSAPLLILGWDGLGLSSYFLIVHYQNFKSSGSGLVTVLSNRIGDIFIISMTAILFSEMTSLYFFMAPSSFELPILLSTLVLLGAITKSAMFPYCTWLPEAMAAPTPVSSLVHSSTLVTAGVYILLRAYPWTPLPTLLAIGALSGFTLLLSSGSALFCLDFKKVIALSTLSQLAFMLLTLAASLPLLAFFHLITHALFKSSLFMAAGSFIHLGNNNQDMRLKDLSPSASSSFTLIVIPILALAGLPFMTGFFSKETIILSGTYFNTNLILIITMVTGALFTLLYSSRMMFSLSFANSTMKMPAETSIMDFSKVFLITSSVIGGWFILNGITPKMVYSPILSPLIQGIFIFSFLLWLSCLILFSPKKGRGLNQFYYLARITNTSIPKIQIPSSKFMLSLWESGWQEILGPKLIISSTTNLLTMIYSLSSFQFKALITSCLISLILTISLL